MYSKSSWISGNRLSQLRADIRTCPNPDYREEGLAMLRGVRTGQYLLNLIPQDHPDRIGIVNYLLREIID